MVNSAEALFWVLSESLETSEEYCINVLLPKELGLSGIIAHMQKIEQCMSQVIFDPEIEGRLDLRSWEDGSKWIKLFLGTQATVVLIGSIAWPSAVVYKKVQEARMFQEHVESLSLKNESLEDVLDGQKRAIDLLIDAEARLIQSESFSNENNNEKLERIKLAVKTFSELMQQGAEIHPALSAPEDVGNLFPDFKNIMLIESKQKLLQADQPET